MTPLDRRCLLAGIAACAAAPLPALAQDAPGLVVAGPPGTRLDRWADPLSRALGRGFTPQGPLRRVHVGGLDGVTGANDFEARGEPDGQTALLLPGSANMAWLVGEGRAKFDPSRWVQLWAAVAQGVLVSRVQLDRRRVLTVAAAGPTGPELPFLLALDLCGYPVALAAPAEADAVLVQGRAIPGAVTAASAAGMNPVLTLGVPDGDDGVSRDPTLPTVPTANEFASGQGGMQMMAALRAATAAAQLDASLVLPSLTPAAAVAAWRRAVKPLPTEAELTAESQRTGTSMLPAIEATGLCGRITAPAETLLALRGWLATQHGWRPT